MHPIFYCGFDDRGEYSIRSIKEAVKAVQQLGLDFHTLQAVERVAVVDCFEWSVCTMEAVISMK